MITNVTVDTNNIVPYTYNGVINECAVSGNIGVMNHEISYLIFDVKDASGNNIGRINYRAPLGLFNSVSLDLSGGHSDLNTLMEVFQGAYAELQESEIINPGTSEYNTESESEPEP